jgi:hypothetical protein
MLTSISLKTLHKALLKGDKQLLTHKATWPLQLQIQIQEVWDCDHYSVQSLLNLVNIKFVKLHEFKNKPHKKWNELLYRLDVSRITNITHIQYLRKKKLFTVSTNINLSSVKSRHF